VSDPLVFISAHELFHLIFFPCPVEKEECESGWVGVWQPDNVSPPEIQGIELSAEVFQCLVEKVRTISGFVLPVFSSSV